MIEESEEPSLILPVGLIVTGVAAFFGASYIKDPKTQLVVKAGGILAAVGGVIIGGEVLLDKIKLGFTGIFKRDIPKPSVGSPGPLIPFDNAAGGSRFLSPLNNSQVDVGVFSPEIPIKVRIVNDSGSVLTSEIRIDVEERYALLPNERDSMSLGVVSIPAHGSKPISITYPIAGQWWVGEATIEMKLIVDGVVADTISVIYY